jgi:sigma-E factor negative regulatory protein RseB
LSRRLYRLPAFVAVAIAAAAPAALGQDAAGDVKGWLDRMNVAIEQVNYRGTFVHVVDGNPETLEIVHRYADGVVGEKISSNVEDGREILRTHDLVRSVFPEKRLVVVEEPERSSIPVAPSLNYNDDLENYYQLTTFPKGSVAGRHTQVVSIRARDEFRYGYLLWLDRDNGLPLKIQVRDDTGTVIESILFTEISVLDSIPEFAVAPSIDVEGFTWKRPARVAVEELRNENWDARRLPGGFWRLDSRQVLLAGSRYPVQHLVYTDGLATVSVFIAHPLSDADMPEGFSRFGSTNAYSLKIDGRLATAIGEVPGRTVQRIATSLDVR